MTRLEPRLEKPLAADGTADRRAQQVFVGSARVGARFEVEVADPEVVDVDGVVLELRLERERLGERMIEAAADVRAIRRATHRRRNRGAGNGGEDRLRLEGVRAVAGQRKGGPALDQR